MGVKYPNVECLDHPGQIEPGYMVCVHIEKPEDIAHFEEATEDRLGALVCAVCYARKDEEEYTMDNTTLRCAPGLRERGMLVKIQ